MPFTAYDLMGSVETELGTITIGGVALPVMLINLEIDRKTHLQHVPFANKVFGTVIVDYYTNYDEQGGRLSFDGLIKEGSSPGTTTAPNIIAYIKSTQGKWIYTTIVIGTNTYNRCKCLGASLKTGDIGGRRVVYGSLTFSFAYVS